MLVDCMIVDNHHSFAMTWYENLNKTFRVTHMVRSLTLLIDVESPHPILHDKKHHFGCNNRIARVPSWWQALRKAINVWTTWRHCRRYWLSKRATRQKKLRIELLLLPKSNLYDLLNACFLVIAKLSTSYSGIMRARCFKSSRHGRALNSETSPSQITRCQGFLE